MAESMNGNFSFILCRLLDSLGLDEENRKRRMACQKMRQLLLSWEYESLKASSFLLLCGSAYETTTLKGLSSDIDILMIQHGIRIVNDISQWQPNLEKLQYIVDSTNCYKSFTKLYLLSLDYPGILYRDTIRGLPPDHVVDEEGRILLTHVFIERLQSMMGQGFQQHGPALQHSEKDVNIETDQVIAFPCYFFPNEAASWKFRQTPETLAKFGENIFNEADCCYLVGVGNKDSSTNNVEWRISLSGVERHLVHAWNNVQYKCYIMMKFINKDLIATNLLDPEMLSSYYFKTILMWMVEEYPTEFFVESNFEKCLKACLRNIATAVRNRSLPHYFFEGCNLLFNKFEPTTAECAALLIEAIAGSLPISLLQIKRRSLGEMLNACLMNRVPLMDVCSEARLKRMNDIVFFEVADEFFQVTKQYVKSKNYLFEKDNADLIKFLSVLKKIFMKTYRQDTEAKQFISSAMKDYLCSLGLKMVLYCEVTTNKTVYFNKRIGLGLIKTYVNDCCLHTGLEVAGYFLMRGDYQLTLALLQILEQQITPFTGCFCSHDRCSKRANMQHKRAIFITKPSMKMHFKRYLAAAVVYEKEKISHVPKALVYEMFRTTSISPPMSPLQSNPQEYNWHNHAVIHSPVYLYYLRFLCNQALGNKALCQTAVDKMELTSNEMISYEASHWETSPNVIGHCERAIGNELRAYKAFRKSLTRKKYHNSAIWHLALLLRNRIYQNS